MKTLEAQGTAPRFRVGSRVSFQFGQDRLIGAVIEDRGPLGGGGRQLLRIEVPFEGEEPLVTELPADLLQPA